MKQKISLWRYGLIGFLTIEIVIWSQWLLNKFFENLPFSLSIFEDTVLAIIWGIVILLIIFPLWFLLIGYLSTKIIDFIRETKHRGKK